MHYLGPHYFVGLFQLVCGRWGSVRPVAVKEFISALLRDLRLKAGLQVKFFTCLDAYYKLVLPSYPLDRLPAQSRLLSVVFFQIFIFSLHSPLDGGSWFQTVELHPVLECDWKMRFIVPKNHPERKRTSILVC